MKITSSVLVTFAEIAGGILLSWMLGPKLVKKDGSPLLAKKDGTPLVPNEVLVGAGALAAALFGPKKWAVDALFVAMGALAVPLAQEVHKKTAQPSAQIAGAPWHVGQLPGGAAMWALPPPGSWGPAHQRMYAGAGFPVS